MIDSATALPNSTSSSWPLAPRVQTSEVKLLVLLTKADKLNRKEAAESMRKAQEVLAEVVTDESDVGLVLFSALKSRAWATRHWPAGMDGIPEESEAEALAQQQAAAGKSPMSQRTFDSFTFRNSLVSCERA